MMRKPRNVNGDNCILLMLCDTIAYRYFQRLGNGVTTEQTWAFRSASSKERHYVVELCLFQMLVIMVNHSSSPRHTQNARLATVRHWCQKGHLLLVLLVGLEIMTL